jgi:hypothetical protein
MYVLHSLLPTELLREFGQDRTRDAGEAGGLLFQQSCACGRQLQRRPLLSATRTVSQRLLLLLLMMMMIIGSTHAPRARHVHVCVCVCVCHRRAPDRAWFHGARAGAHPAQ